MEWAPFKSLFWNTTVYYKRHFFLRQTLLSKYVRLLQRQQMPKTFWQHKSRLSLIIEQILSFTSNSNMVREGKNLSLNFKQCVWWCFTLLDILIRIVRSILTQSSTKNYTQLVYSWYNLPLLMNKPCTSYFFHGF